MFPPEGKEKIKARSDVPERIKKQRKISSPLCKIAYIMKTQYI